jgi:hypothetical protein
MAEPGSREKFFRRSAAENANGNSSFPFRTDLPIFVNSVRNSCDKKYRPSLSFS